MPIILISKELTETGSNSIAAVTLEDWNSDQKLREDLLTVSEVYYTPIEITPTTSEEIELLIAKSLPILEPLEIDVPQDTSEKDDDPSENVTTT